MLKDRLHELWDFDLMGNPKAINIEILKKSGTQGEEGRLLAAVRLLPAVLPHRRHRRHHRRHRHPALGGCFGNRLGTDPRHHLAVPAQGSAQHALTPAPQFFLPLCPPGTGRDFYSPGKSASFCRRIPCTITSTAARCSSVSPVRSSPGSGGVRPSR